MKNIDDVFRAVEFIENNLRESVTVEDVARSVDYSLFHFSRIFNSVTGHSPYDYIMRRRLSEAAKEMIESERKIIDIAFDYQFNNYETFLRAFKKMTGILPNEYRKHKVREDIVLESPITYDYLKYINITCCLKPELVKMDGINLAAQNSN